jgi:primosomal replication protein N''
MTLSPESLVRLCPNCRTERPVSELSCEGILDGNTCNWDLTNEPVIQAGGASARAPEPPPVPVGRRCLNGHSLGPGDEICLICGLDAAPDTAAPDAGAPDPALEEPPPEETVIDGWHVLRRVSADDEPWERFTVRGSDRDAELTLYRDGIEPDLAVQEARRRLPKGHAPELLATGRFGGRAYEVVEHIAGTSLRDVGGFAAGDVNLLRGMAEQAGRILAAFAEAGLRHCDLRPGTLLVRQREPLELMVTDFRAARLSDFDLETVANLEVTRYSAPEVIIGAVSAASDWWSLGMILLEQATAGACFEGVNEKAFLIHVVTRGIELSVDLEPEVRLPLRGLLACDPATRWGWPQIRSWLAGEAVEAPAEAVAGQGEPQGPTIELDDRRFGRPEHFALAAADAQAWDAARDLTLRGAVVTWLDDLHADRSVIAGFRRVVSDERLSDDLRHSLGLMALNRSLPLILKGNIVTPAWLLQNPVEGYEIISGETARHLERMKRETWLVEKRMRAEAVRERAKLLEIELDEERLRIALLASSRTRLETERAHLRELFPETDHAGLASLLERQRLSEEDLVIVIAAAHHQFTPLAGLISAARQQAGLVGMSVDTAAAQQSLVRPRREIFTEIDERIANFARCGNARIDEWADSFRIERRMPLARAAVLLAVPRERWQEPPRQQYVANLLQHFEKRVSGSVQRGPLVRFVLGKTTPRVDLFELETSSRPAEFILNHILARTDMPIAVDPGALGEPLGERLRRLASHASLFRRDTGIDGRYLGFPFLLSQDARVASANAKTRIAPVLLWPVVLDVQTGAGATLAFDREREDIRLNPALEGLLGLQVYAQWQEARQALLEQPTAKIGDVMDIFGSLATPRGRKLVAIPGPATRIARGARELAPCAALFNAEFTGQAISEDLRQLQHVSPEGTGLETAFRISPEGPPVPALPPVREADRFLVVDSDPSQEAAVLRAGMSPGLLVEGPPGTGKSQTIVNIVADSVGRGEKILIVCQKQAALKVVQKRLEAEGLGNRLFTVVDANRDRESIVRALRDQVPQVRGLRANRVATLKRNRQSVATRIETLEGDLDRYHTALHDVDERSGSSYRSLLGELIAVETGAAIIDVPVLRHRFAEADRSEVTRLEETCSPLARLWLDSGYEGSALGVLRQFSVDGAVQRAFASSLSGFLEKEEAHQEVLAQTSPSFAIQGEDPASYRAWLDGVEPVFADFAALKQHGFASWFDLFRSSPASPAIGDAIIGTLDKVGQELASVERRGPDAGLLKRVTRMETGELEHWLPVMKKATAKVSAVGRLNPARWLRRRRARAFLRELGEEPTDARLAALRDAIAVEAFLRKRRAIVDEARNTLTIQPSGAATLAALRQEAETLAAWLRVAQAAAAAAAACPRPRDAETMAKSESAASFAALRRDFEDAIRRHAAGQASREALAALAQWMQPDWVAARDAAIGQGASNVAKLVTLRDAMPTLESYQRFRARANDLDSGAIAIFAILRETERSLRAVPADLLEDQVRHMIQREALLAWKGRLETAWPVLLVEKEELRRKIETLADLDRQFRKLNRELLAEDFDLSRLGTQTEWDDLTRLRGPRMKRLREILDTGPNIGLIMLRPIWLMNPDVASRVLPRRAGLFDVVIYDEASQMLVEHAIPTLFRAGRVVISGDEKQMPPSAFFTSRLDSDEDEELEESDDEAATEGELLAREEKWNRREIKDCPDLLQLGRGVLPATTLQVHYRSKYRELIGYSNAAFYGGKLSVPARHPDDEVRRATPIKVMRVDGVYESQTNKAEADKVVEVLAEIWSRPPEQRPTVGVATFNRGQADMVEEAIEKRARKDADFRSAYRQECERTKDGEDVGFFVKNVENVQGDERDTIIFSTTFGYDRQGTFRRNFGVLGQTGGERRLNVAVTRAKEKIFILTSMPVDKISGMSGTTRTPVTPRDYLQTYLDYAARMSSGDLDSARAATRRFGTLPKNGSVNGVEDGFIASVEAFIRELGHEPTPSDDGDAFGLDFAIRDARTGLFGIGVECDAPRHELLRHARAREIWRPGVLARAIPKVHRVVSHGWYHRPDHERGQLRAAIETALAGGVA